MFFLRCILLLFFVCNERSQHSNRRVKPLHLDVVNAQLNNLKHLNITTQQRCCIRTPQCVNTDILLHHRLVKQCFLV
jgi:hypothetical protein